MQISTLLYDDSIFQFLYMYKWQGEEVIIRQEHQARYNLPLYN